MSKKTTFVLLLIAVILSAVSLPVRAQTVGDTFIDTSEWVQSSSPIRENGVAQGYITETIVRGYRSPSYDQYYDSAQVNSATEFSSQSKIQPVVFENSQSNSTSLEPDLRPTPDPVIQAANLQSNPSSSELNGRNVSSVYQSNLRGFSSRAQYNAPVSNNFNAESLDRSQGQVYRTSLVQQPAYPQNQFRPGQNYQYPASQYAPQYAAPTPYLTSSFAQTQFVTPPANTASTLRNCCDPVYVQTQFTTPQANSGVGALRTYPQYNQNPYPNPGFGISQPYVRDTWVPMIPLRSMPYGTYLGQGIIGQPVAYVNGEPVRNFLRYVFP